MKTRIILAVALAIPLTYCATRGREIDPPARAKAACRGEIVKRLKDPSSAEFGKSSVSEVGDGLGWRVWREVSAKNSFGAVVKSVQVCDVAPDFTVTRVTRGVPG